MLFVIRYGKYNTFQIVECEINSEAEALREFLDKALLSGSDLEYPVYVYSLNFGATWTIRPNHTMLRNL